MLKSNIIDGGGSKDAAFVEDNALVVTQYTCPPMLPQRNKIFIQNFTLDGTANGVSDMLVDGSGTNAVFYVPAHDENDRYITYINFVIADDGVNLKLFGKIAALTNGCQLYYERTGETVFVHEALKTNWDFMRMSINQTPIPSIGTQKNVEGKTDAYTPVVDFKSLMPPYGIKLDAGSSQKIAIKIRDDVSGIDTFNCIAYGFERFS